jgi:hypothetical protein
MGARAPRAQESVRTGFRTGGTNSGILKGFGNCALLRSRFPVVLLALPQGEEAEVPDESARPAPPTSPSFKNSLRVNAMQLPFPVLYFTTGRPVRLARLPKAPSVRAPVRGGWKRAYGDPRRRVLVKHGCCPLPDRRKDYSRGSPSPHNGWIIFL